MIAILKRDPLTTIYAFEMPNPESDVEDDTVPLPEIVIWEERYFVLRGLQWNDHATRHELVYERATEYVV